MKKLIAFPLLFLLILPLSAVPFSVSASTGIRFDQTSRTPAVFSMSGEVGNLSIDLQYQAGGGLLTALDYRFGDKQNTSHIISASSTFFPEDKGGWTGISYLFSQNFIWDFFSIRYGIGVQGSVSWSHYSRVPLWSLAPLLSLSAAFSLDPIRITFYASINHRWDRSWRFRPYCGLLAEGKINENNAVFVDSYITFAEMLMDRVVTDYAWSIRAGYIYRSR